MGCCSSSKKEDDRGAAGHVHEESAINEADIVATMILTDGANPLSSRVELSISCTDLEKMDRSSQSDPFCVIYIKKSANDEWSELGRTEIIANTQAPKFVTLIPMTYHFEEVQYLRFVVYDADTSFTSTDATTLNLSDQDLQGSAEVTLAQIMGGLNCSWTGQLENPQIVSQGKISIRGEELSNQNAIVKLQLRAEKLDSKQGISKPSSFLRMSRVPERGDPIPFFKTEVRKASNNPAWDELKTNLQILSNGDPYRPILFECFGWKKSGSHDFIGSAQKSLNDLTSLSANKQEIQLQSGNGSPAGHLVVEQCEITPQASFLNYIAGGTEIAFTVAIDYTASNGDPVCMDSLHYVDPTGQQLNSYAQAMLGVGHVLEYYDSDKLFPVYGFGGKVTVGGTASHCFAVNMNEAGPEVQGVKGILDSYYASLQQVKLSGPTIFQNVISSAAAFAASTVSSDPSRQKYHILLILTDGIINDMQNTIDAIVQASTLPFSIVIVGVGNADFTAMEVLDADDKRLISSSGTQAARDIVQFVPMNKFAHTSPEVIAREVLYEIPRQFLDYMQANSISPMPAR